MTARGLGIGIEIGARVVRAVRLHTDCAGEPVAAVAIERASGSHGLVDALIRAAVELDAPAGIPVRMAWFPIGASIEASDVTDHHPADVAETLAQWSATGHGAAVVTEHCARRWVALVRWSSAGVVQLERAATRAGLDHAVCEPSPLAVARLAAGWSGEVVRDDADGVAWRAELVDGTVRRADTSPVKLPTGAAATIELEPAAEWVEAVGERWHVTGDGRDVVALGAAVGAAGLAGLRSPIRPLGPSDDGAGWLRWAVEHVADEVPAVAARTTERWSRLRRRRRAMAGGGRR